MQTNRRRLKNAPHAPLSDTGRPPENHFVHKIDQDPFHDPKLHGPQRQVQERR